MRVLMINSDEVVSLLEMADVMGAIEMAFHEKGLGRVQMPPKSYLFFERHNGDLRTMPAYFDHMDIAAVKVVNVHPDNPSHDMPTIMGTILLVDTPTGAVKAILDGTMITAMRTGAAGGVAARHLARPNSRTVGIIGAGAQAKNQLRALVEVLPVLESARVTDRNMEVANAFAEEMSLNLGMDITACVEVEDTVTDADVVVTVTPSRIPLVMDEWISDGTHINAIGADAPGKQELDPQLLMRSRILVDDWEQAIHCGEINVPYAEGVIGFGDIAGELGDVVTGRIEGRRDEREITVFVSTGLALQDAAVADLVYRKARERGWGTSVLL